MINRTNPPSVSYAAQNLSLSQAAQARQNILAQNAGTTFDASFYGLTTGSDCQLPLSNLFSIVSGVSSTSNQCTINIPPGNYTVALTGIVPVIPSNTTINAIGANFILPTGIPTGNSTYPLCRIFSGLDINNFIWNGGNFSGYVFNDLTIPYTSNYWKPKESVTVFNFESSAGNGCNNCTWNQVNAVNVGGNIILVNGINAGTLGTSTYNYNNVTTFSNNINLINCNFTNCGQFMWDYGYLWQILSFAQQYTANQTGMAFTYMNPTSMYGIVNITSGSNWVLFNNSGSNLPAINVSQANSQTYTASFWGDALPTGINTGLQYFVVGSGGTGIQISTTFNGSPITFGSGAQNVQMLYNLQNAYQNLYLPYGATENHGCFDIRNAQNVLVQGCKWSAPGDSARISACVNTNLIGNNCIDAKMGMLWIQGSKYTTVNGGRYNAATLGGSRAITVEYACVDTVIDSVQFINGGRGNLLDSPSGLIIKACKFYNNCNRSNNNYVTGRIDPSLGTFVVNSMNTLNSSSNLQWFNVQMINCDILSNSALNVFDIASPSSGNGLIFSDNIVQGTHMSIKNENNVANRIQNIIIGEGIGLAGFRRALVNIALTGQTFFQFGNLLTNAVQSNVGVQFAVTATPANAYAANSIAYASGDATNITLFFTGSLSGAASYSYTYQATPL